MSTVRVRSAAIPALASLLLLTVAGSLSAQTSLTIAPSQVYVSECQEGFVVLTGTNLTGTVSTLVDFSGNSQLYELEPSTAAPDRLEVWIPMGVALATGQYTISVKAIDSSGTRTLGPTTLSVVARSGGAPPLVSLPEVVVTDAASSSGAYVTFDAGGASCDHVSGSLFPVGTTTVTCTSSNGFGTTTATFLVVVNSSTGGPPILALPEVVVAEATSASGAAVSFSTGGATCDHVSGSSFPIGNTTVSCTSTNSFGTSSGSFIVIVADTTQPTLTLPADFTTTTNIVSYTASANDAIDGSLTPVCSPLSGSNFQTGITAVQCTVTDTHANTAVGSFRVTVAPLTLADFTASQDVYQLNASVSGLVTYTSNVPVTLNETLTIRSDATGAVVRTLVNTVRAPGTYQNIWNGTNDAGQLVPDGTYHYFVTVSAGGSTFAWDDSAYYIGGTITQYEYPKCRNDGGALVACNDTSVVFDPYANKPLRINYCVGSGNPPTCANTGPYLVYIKATSATETDAICLSSNCILSALQAGGPQEFLWYGRSWDSTFDVSGAGGVTVIRRNDAWARNMTIVYGTAPAISNLTVSPAVFNPAFSAGGGSALTFSMTVASFQSRAVYVRIELKNITSQSILRTIQTPLMPAGQLTVTWDGHADNGALVAPSLYEAKVTVTDSVGSSTISKPQFTIRYE